MHRGKKYHSHQCTPVTALEGSDELAREHDRAFACDTCAHTVHWKLRLEVSASDHVWRSVISEFSGSRRDQPLHPSLPPVVMTVITVPVP